MYAKTKNIQAFLTASPDVLPGDLILVPYIANYGSGRGNEIEYRALLVRRNMKNKIQLTDTTGQSLYIDKHDQNGQTIIYLVEPA